TAGVRRSGGDGTGCHDRTASPLTRNQRPVVRRRPRATRAWSRPCSEALREDLLVTAKHFPGYRDTLVDSHRAVASVDGDLAHPVGGRASRSKWQSNPAWMRAGGIQLEQVAASIGIRFYVVILLVFLSGPA